MLQSFSTNTGTPRCLFEVLLEGHIFPALHVGGEDDPALGEIHRARSANADAGHLFEVEVGFIHRVLDAAGDALDDGIDAALGLGAELGGADAFERVLEDTRQDLGAAEINADDVFSFVAGFGHIFVT